MHRHTKDLSSYQGIPIAETNQTTAKAAMNLLSKNIQNSAATPSKEKVQKDDSEIESDLEDHDSYLSSSEDTSDQVLRSFCYAVI